MNREETLALYELAQKEGVEAWNKWANEMLEKRKRLEKAGKWAAEINFKGLLEGQNSETRNWIELAEVNFSKKDTPEEINIDFNCTSIIFPADTFFEKAQFNKGVNFNDAIFNGTAIFSYSKFYSDTNFINTNFTGHTSFFYSEFFQDTVFIKSNFNEYADFRNLIVNKNIDFKETFFKESAEFSNSYFHEISGFDHAVFVKYTDFNFCIFDNFITFEGSEFKCKTNFKNCVFNNQSDFNLTKFKKNANFTQTKFNKIVKFEHSEFYGDVWFTNAFFKEKAHFHEAIFYDIVCFLSCQFSDDVNYNNCVFNKGVWFNSSSFLGETIFVSSVLKKQTHFENTTFHKLADFYAIKSDGAFLAKQTYFINEVPNFIQANFKEAPRLDQIEIGKNALPGRFSNSLTAHIPSDIKARYQALKRLAIQAHDHENEQNFWAGELRSDRSLRTEDGGWNLRPLVSAFWWGNIAYGCVSDYGYSIVKPIGALLILICLMTGLHLTKSKTPLTYDQAFSAGYISTNKSFLYLGADPTKRSIIKEKYSALYGANENQTPKIPKTILTAEFFQTLFSAIFIFLALLGIRNNFKMK
jgi:hypothetical protein